MNENMHVSTPPAPWAANGTHETTDTVDAKLLRDIAIQGVPHKIGQVVECRRGGTRELYYVGTMGTFLLVEGIDAEVVDDVAAPGRNQQCPCGSGKKFKKCHGVDAQVPTLAAPTTGFKLDLGAGQNPREGFEGVDIYPGAKHVVDLLKFPWPFADESVDELHCSHFAEHIHAREIEERDISAMHPDVGTIAPDARLAVFSARCEKFVGQDMFLAFFDECYRILKKDAFMTVIVPALRSNRAFQDPTHRRFIPAETFLYLAAEWRKQNKLDHYRVKCNFGVNVNPTIPQELGLLSAEHQSRRINESWNCVFDFHAALKKLPLP